MEKTATFKEHANQLKKERMVASKEKETRKVVDLGIKCVPGYDDDHDGSNEEKDEKEERIKYSTHFDRRHNVNIVNSYDFGKELAWTANVRWNFGSGFPFTLTQGFYEALDLSQGASTEITAENGELGIYYDDLNKGRLPYYHRLDASIKRRFKIKTKKENVFNKAEVIFSVTNIYNRENIFYFDRVNYKRENQLPLLPSLSASFSF